jgi:hypothetical protein
MAIPSTTKSHPYFTGQSVLLSMEKWGKVMDEKIIKMFPDKETVEGSYVESINAVEKLILDNFRGIKDEEKQRLLVNMSACLTDR